MTTLNGAGQRLKKIEYARKRAKALRLLHRLEAINAILHVGGPAADELIATLRRLGVFKK